MTGKLSGGTCITRDAVKTCGAPLSDHCPFKLLAGPGGMCQRKQEHSASVKEKTAFCRIPAVNRVRRQ
jgi:hypothetical protein